MTTRHSGYVVALEDDIREDDAEHVLNALRMVKGVMSVQAIETDRGQQFIAEERLDRKWRTKLYNLAQDGPGTE